MSSSNSFAKPDNSGGEYIKLKNLNGQLKN